MLYPPSPIRFQYSQAHLEKTRHRHRDWVTGETNPLAEQARLARIQSAPNHRELRKQIKRTLHRDRTAYWKAISEETRRAAACGDTRKLYQMLKSVTRRPAGVGEILLERDGSVIPDQGRKLRRWEGHFKELLNHAAPLNTAFSPPDTPAAENYPCAVDPPTLDEVCTAIRQLRNNRAPGEDGIPWGCARRASRPWAHGCIG